MAFVTRPPGFVPRPPGVVDIRERASKRETPSRGREGAKRGGSVAPAGPSWSGSGPQRAGAWRGRCRRRRAVPEAPWVADAAGTGRSGREASPGGPATAAAMALSAPSEVGPERAAQRERARSRATADPLRRWEGSRAARESGRSVRDGRGAEFHEGRGGRHGQCSGWVLRMLNNVHKDTNGHKQDTNKIQNTHAQS